ncbi:MAG: hypothetical protein A2Y56_15845 [Candidatus Aminicenantes bacterium RBG_13_63_10]|nr:MAG: hypothetical protein A2Y56_15845 [Candidatus Aminicenantes bacterium RBG_13_63_10]
MFPKLAFTALIAVAALGFWLKRRPLHPALILLLASTFFSRIYWEVAGFTVRLEQLTSGLLFVFLALEVLRKRMKPRLDWRSGLMAGLFLMMVLSSLFASPFPSVSLQKTLVYFPYVLGFLALAVFLEAKDRWLKAWDLFYGAGAAALAISLIGFILFLFGINLGMVRVEWGSLWLRGTMVIPNILGSTAVVIFIIALVRSIWKRNETQGNRLDWIVLAIATSCVMISFTRSAWIGSALGIIAVIALTVKKTSPGRLALALAIIAATVGLTYLATTRIKPRFGDMPASASLGEFGEKEMDKYWVREETDEVEYAGKLKDLIGPDASREKPEEGRPENQHLSTIRHRWQIQKIALNDWRLSPLLGRGTDTLILVNDNKPEFYISSSCLTILHDWGILGAGLFAAFVLMTLGTLWKGLRRSEDASRQAAFSSLIVILVVWLLMDQVATTIQLSIFWVLSAFCSLAPPALSDKKKTESEATLSMR